jgi:hypothetical protein
VNLSWLQKRVELEEIDRDWGRIQVQWDELKSLWQPGDEWWEFSSPQKEWNRLAGRAGVALVRRVSWRRREIVGHMLTLVS